MDGFVYLLETKKWDESYIERRGQKIAAFALRLWDLRES